MNWWLEASWAVMVLAAVLALFAASPQQPLRSPDWRAAAIILITGAALALCLLSAGLFRKFIL